MKTDSAILTVAIPTYNRATKLQAQIERLLPQLRDDVILCIYDNASTDSTRQVAEQYCTQGVHYFRAIINGGGGRNFARCFEECRTEWLWILSDDDPVSANAVKNLLSALRNQCCDFIHTSKNGDPYPEDTTVSDISSVFQHTTFGNMVWLSAGVYRMSSFRPLLGLFNESISTWCPQLLIVLSLLESHGGKALLSSVRLIDKVSGPAHTWSTLNCIIRLSFAPEYLKNPVNQQILAERILQDWYYGMLLMALREINDASQIKRWKRIRKQSFRNLRSYRGNGAAGYILRNWFRSGHRKISLHLIPPAFTVLVLGICPVQLFHFLIKILPLPDSVRAEYNKHRQQIC